MSIGQAFDKTVAYYDNWMKLALPSYDRLFASAMELIPFNNDDPIRVLDLGAGTGLFSQLVLENHPRAQFVLVDIAPKMLDLARERFALHPDQFEFRVADYRQFSDKNTFDLIISSLSIHHLSDPEKKKLFANAYRALKPGGVFINVDQVEGPTTDMAAMYWAHWLAEVRAKGAPEDQIQSSIERRTEYDHNALLVDQLRWLSEAGFIDVDCVYKDFFIGVFFAKKAAQ
jgi:tRNA (cmo5U34)-methyltransferase